MTPTDKTRAKVTNIENEVFQVLTLSSAVVDGRESFLTTALEIPKSKTADSEINETRKR